MKKQGYAAISGIVAASLIASLSPIASAQDTPAVPEIPELPDSYVSGGTDTLQVEFQPIPDEARSKTFEQPEETPEESPEVVTDNVSGVSDTIESAQERRAQRTVTVTVTQQPESGSTSNLSAGDIIPENWEGLVDEYMAAGDNAARQVQELADGIVLPPEINTTSLSSMNIPTYDSSAVQSMIEYAYSQIGVPYVWGGTATDVGLDCSGLTQNAYAAAGISIPRVTYDQINSGPRISVNNIQPGDLVFYNGTGHVALYIGDGKVIHAPQTGQNVKIDSLTMMPVEAVVRPSA